MVRAGKDGNVDGHSAEFVIRLPGKVHLGAIAIFAVFVGVELGKVYLSPNSVKILASVSSVLPGGIGAILAFYVAFYARQTFIMTRQRDRMIRTLEFSRQFSLPPMTEARQVIMTRYNRLLLRFEQENERHADVKANQVLSRKIGDAFENRGTGKEIAGDVALIDPTMMMLDYFEDLGLGIKKETLDEDVARELLKPSVTGNWKRFKMTIDLLRAKRGDESIYEHFEWLRNKWT